MQVSVIISTYNSPAWLEKVLWGYQQQHYREFELVLADDGSGEPTRKLVEEIRNKVDYPIRHVWHEDDGFRKSTILNKAIEASGSDYLVFSDGDCIPRTDFLSVHVRRRKPGHFLSGGYFKLPMDTSEAITMDDISAQRCFQLPWLHRHGLKPSFKDNKLSAGSFKAWVLNTFTTTRATINGHNASVWKKDAMAVNGYDERMRYGGQDREFGERLVNLGIRGIQIRYSAICIHLDHGRGYANEADLQTNLAIRAATRNEKKTRTEYGIIKETAA